MDNDSQAVISQTATQTGLKRVLNVGAGPASARRLHPAFARNRWEEVRLDVDPTAKPDFVGSITDLTLMFETKTFDAVWASHVLEHLYAHEISAALLQMRSILKPDGFAVITSPDLEAAAHLIVQYGLDHIAYISPAGPITTHDLFFGHSSSIARGHYSMAHKTGFTCPSLAQCLLKAGFPTVLAKADRFDLWAVALMEQADRAAIEQQLGTAGLDMFSPD